MQLSDALIAKFRQAHLEEYGESVSAEEAEAELLGLAELVCIADKRTDLMEKDMNNE